MSNSTKGFLAITILIVSYPVMAGVSAGIHWQRGYEECHEFDKHHTDNIHTATDYLQVGSVACGFFWPIYIPFAITTHIMQPKTVERTGNKEAQ